MQDHYKSLIRKRLDEIEERILMKAIRKLYDSPKAKSRNQREGWYGGRKSPGFVIKRHHSRTKNPHLRLWKPKKILLDAPEFGVIENFHFIQSNTI